MTTRDIASSTRSQSNAILAMQKRSRWDGVLSQEELTFCKQNHISVGYDCAQIGWVVLNSENEIFDGQRSATPIMTTTELDLGKTIETLRVTLAEEMSINVQSQAAANGQQNIDITEALHTAAVLAGNIAVRSDIRSLDRAHCVLINEVAKLLKYAPPTAPNTAALSYRPWHEDDLKAYMAIMGNRNVWRYLPEPYPSPFDEALALSLIKIANIGDHDSIQAIERNGDVVGQVRLLFNNDYPELHIAEVAYLLGEDHWGQGLMPKILDDFTQRCFATHPLDFIYAWIRPENTASVKCAEQAGYIKDNFAREAELAKLSKRPGFTRYIRFRSRP